MRAAQHRLFLVAHTVADALQCPVPAFKPLIAVVTAVPCVYSLVVILNIVRYHCQQYLVWGSHAHHDEVTVLCDGVALKVFILAARYAQHISDPVPPNVADVNFLCEQCPEHHSSVIALGPGHNPGKKVEICSECNAVREVAIPATEPHEWTEGTAENGITPLSCACGQVGMQFDGFTGDNAGNIEGTKVNKGKTFTWTLTMPKAGKVAVSIHMAYGSGKGSKKIGSASSYVLKCGDNNGSISVNDETYAALLGDKDSVYSYLEFGTVNVPAGQATITFTYGNQNDRLLSDKLVRIIYLD